MKETQLTDVDLMNLLRQDSKTAFNELYNRHCRKLYSMARRNLHSTQVSQELIQNLFVCLWTNRKSLQIEGSVSTYLSTAVRYMIIKYFQAEQSHKQ